VPRAPISIAKALSSLLALLLVTAMGMTLIASPALAGGGKRHFTIVGFALNCKYAKSLPDDPVLLHGQPGASPGNDFYAATNVDANSTFTTLRQSASTCITKYDTSAYFQPQLLLGGQPQTPKAVYDYYEIPNGADPPSIKQWPNDFAMLATAAHIYWTCGGGGTPHQSAPYNCADYGSTGTITAYASFPTCWDGADPSTPADTVYPANQVCPSQFTTRIPQLTEQSGWLITDGTKATFTTGDASTFRAEYMNGWDPAYLGMLMATCINANVACGSLWNSGDKPPKMDSVKILPSPAYATDTLTAQPVNLRDPDGDAITCTYAWTLNGKPVGGDSIQLDPSLFTVGDVLTVTVTPTDSWGVQGTPVTSAAVTVATDLAAKAPASPGGPVTLLGGGFAANESVALTVDSPSGPSLGSVSVGTDGSFTAFATTVPTPLPGGAHTIYGVGNLSHIQGQGSLTVVPGGSLAPGHVPAGGTASFSGVGFAPYEMVVTSFPGGVPTTVAADASGSMSATVLSPAEPGPRNTVTATAPSGTASVSYIVDTTMTMPTKGEPNVPVPFSITGYGASETVDALVNNIKTGQTFTTDGSGSYAGTVTIQGNFANNYFVRMTGETSGQSKMLQIDLLAYVAVAPASGPVGTLVTVTSLFGWIPGETVHLRVAGIQLPDVIADPTGSVITTFTVPQHAPGNISVVLADDLLGISPSTSFAITG
jgi:Domain of unknown function (DUF1996)